MHNLFPIVKIIIDHSKCKICDCAKMRCSTKSILYADVVLKDLDRNNNVYSTRSQDVE